MEFSEAIRSRRSVRQFRNAPVPDRLVNAILEAGRAAPSAGNLQARVFFVPRKHDLLEQLVEATPRQKSIAQASVAVVVCANLERIAPYGRRGVELYCLQDAAASVQNMLLTIHALGLASCWIGAFEESVVTRILELPPPLRPVAILPIGWPDETPTPSRPRRTDDDHVLA
jgi:nitroreductase